MRSRRAIREISVLNDLTASVKRNVIVTKHVGITDVEMIVVEEQLLPS